MLLDGTKGGEQERCPGKGVGCMKLQMVMSKKESP